MGLIHLFSKRHKPLPSQDTFTYDSLPQPLRVQVMHLWTDALGKGEDGQRNYGNGFSDGMWTFITETMAREHGLVTLVTNDDGYDAAVVFLVHRDPPVDQALDIIELSFRLIDGPVRENWNALARREAGITQEPDDAIAELNHRFLEHGVGYQFESGKLIRLDTTYTHAEVVKPALTLLAKPEFKNAQAEFLTAHEAYRHRRYSDCLNEALKAFESTMKIICDARGWKCKHTDTAKPLIATVLDNGLVSSSYQEQLTNLRKLLESGTPTTRNKNAGHGVGASTASIPDYLAAYGLNTAAANILLLANAHAATP